MLWMPGCRMGPGRGWRLISIISGKVHESIYEEDRRVDWTHFVWVMSASGRQGRINFDSYSIG